MIYYFKDSLSLPFYLYITQVLFVLKIFIKKRINCVLILRKIKYFFNFTFFKFP